MNQQELLSNSEINTIRERFIEKDIVHEDILEDIEKKRKLAGTSKVILAEVFLTCYDSLAMNVYLFEDIIKIEKYLKDYSEIADNLRNLFEDMEDPLFPSPYFSQEKIKDIVNLNRTKMNEIIQLFFKIFKEEE